MILPFHILIALASVGYTTFLYLKPTKGKLFTSYTLVGLTLTSGTYLVITNPAHLASACVTGLIYTGFTLAGIVSARRKLEVSVVENSEE